MAEHRAPEHKHRVECTECHEVRTLKRLPKSIAAYVCTKCSKLGKDLKLASQKGGFRFGV